MNWVTVNCKSIWSKTGSNQRKADTENILLKCMNGSFGKYAQKLDAFQILMGHMNEQNFKY